MLGSVSECHGRYTPFYLYGKMECDTWHRVSIQQGYRSIIFAKLARGKCQFLRIATGNLKVLLFSRYTVHKICWKFHLFFVQYLWTLHSIDCYINSITSFDLLSCNKQSNYYNCIKVIKGSPQSPLPIMADFLNPFNILLILYRGVLGVTSLVTSLTRLPRKELRYRTPFYKFWL